MRRSVMGRRIRALGVAAVAVIALMRVGGAAAQVRPDASYREMESPNFHVTYEVGLEPIARRVIDAAERSRALLLSTLTSPPDGKVDILVVDATDLSNGFASPFPSNRIVLYARPPVDDEALSYSTDWVEMVVAHELTHTFQLDRAGSVGRFLRSVFGRMPLIFPLFPGVGTPSWNTEGLAVDVESAYTGLGRLYGSEHEMIVRTAVLAGEPDRMDRLNESSPIWPGGQRAYIYGSLFMDFLKERYGEDVHARLIERTSSAILPPFLFWDQVARHAFEESFDQAYAAWLGQLEVEFRALADTISRAGLTTSEPLTQHGRTASHPRVSRDGTRLVYTAEDGKSNVSARVIDLGTGRVARSIRRSGMGVQAWTPAGEILISQYEFEGPFQIRSDLWLEPSGRRVTRGARVQAPDVSADGRIVAVVNGNGRADLALVDLRSGEARAITNGEASVLWSQPRWSPDGSRIAASRWTGDGQHAILVLDTMGAVLTTIVSGTELNMAPAWSPDGRYVLFSSDRTGITNLYAADLDAGEAPRIWQVTNVLSGAFQPEVSSSGDEIYFSGYHAGGYAIERMRFDPASWRVPSPARLHAEPRAGEGAESGSPGDTEADAMTDGEGEASTTQLTPSSYSPWRTLLPTFWAPVLTGADEAGTFLGASIRGEDLVGRHGFSATASIDVEGSGRWEGGLSYSNARLGRPILTVTVRRRWDDLGDVTLPQGPPGRRLERDDAVQLYATFPFRRWRTSASFTAGIERQWYRQTLIAPPQYRLRDPDDTYTSLFGSFSVANTQTPAYAISREDGFTFAVAAEHSIESASTVFRDSTGTQPESFDEFRTAGAIYKSVDAGGFAHHVIAIRGSGFLSTGDGAALQRLGGATGSYAELLGFEVTSGSRLLPMRGFSSGVIAGTRAWTATAEWRAPIALVGRRPEWSPVFVDRISANAFIDMGDAWCSEEEQSRSPYCRSLEIIETPLVAVGAEAVLDFGFAGIFTARLRAGFGVPLRGPEDRVRTFLLLGSNF